MRDEELLPCFTLTRAELAALVVLKGVRDEGLRVWLQQHTILSPQTRTGPSSSSSRDGDGIEAFGWNGGFSLGAATWGGRLADPVKVGVSSSCVSDHLSAVFNVKTNRSYTAVNKRLTSDWIYIYVYLLTESSRVCCMKPAAELAFFYKVCRTKIFICKPVNLLSNLVKYY